MNINHYKTLISEFVNERDWDQFHNPKNLVMALSGEVGELTEIFQWLNEEESKNLTGENLQAAQEELADVFIYLLRLSDKLGINLEDAVKEKIKLNAQKYPIESSRGNATKYNQG